MIVAVGLPVFVIGLLAYTGVWRRWARGGLNYIVFGALWWGAGMCVLGLAEVLPRGAAQVTGILGILLAFVGTIAIFWLPAPLTPTWFRALRRSFQR